jgi:putative transposase
MQTWNVMHWGDNMPRRRTRFSPSNFYHVYNRGNNREKIFLEGENYRFFLQKLHTYFELQGICLIAYCLMPNHYHLIVKPNRAIDFSNVMRSFSVSYVKSINKVYHRVGHLFQGNFEARAVESDEYLTHLIRYIHFNPVRAKLVTRAEDWSYSDYAEWISDFVEIDEAKKDVRSKLFGTAEGYREFC